MNLIFPTGSDSSTRRSLFQKFLKIHKIAESNVLYDRVTGKNSVAIAAVVDKDARDKILSDAGTTGDLRYRTGIPGLYKATFRCIPVFLSSAARSQLPHLIGSPVFWLSQRSDQNIVSVDNIVAFYWSKPNNNLPDILPLDIQISVSAPTFSCSQPPDTQLSTSCKTYTQITSSQSSPTSTVVRANSTSNRTEASVPTKSALCDSKSQQQTGPSMRPSSPSGIPPRQPSKRGRPRNIK